MITLNIEKIKSKNSNQIIYEFMLEGFDDYTYLGIDDEYSYEYEVLWSELFKLSDNTLYSNKLFNQWKIKLFRDISLNRNENIEKSKDIFLMLIITNDKKGNIIFSVETPDGGMIYRKSVKLLDFQLFLGNFGEFCLEPYTSFNIYRLDKFFK